MPKELYQLRNAQMKKLQNAKHHQGSTAYFSRKYPDKLFIDDNYIPRNWFNIDFVSFFQHACELIWIFFPSMHKVICYILVRTSVTQCAFFYNRVTPLIFFSHCCRHFVREVKLPCWTFLDLKLKGIVDGKTESRGNCFGHVVQIYVCSLP